MITRVCIDCGTDISEHRRSKRCRNCAQARQKAQDRERYERQKAEAQEPEAYPGEELPVLPPGLQVSVLGLAQELAQRPEASLLIRAILALSPERQDLLRRLLEDAEEVAA